MYGAVRASSCSRYSCGSESGATDESSTTPAGSTAGRTRDTSSSIVGATKTSASASSKPASRPAAEQRRDRVRLGSVVLPREELEARVEVERVRRRLGVDGGEGGLERHVAGRAQLAEELESLVG